jgi:hypothetical protein
LHGFGEGEDPGDDEGECWGGEEKLVVFLGEDATLRDLKLYGGEVGRWWEGRCLGNLGWVGWWFSSFARLELGKTIPEIRNTRCLNWD